MKQKSLPARGTVGRLPYGRRMTIYIVSGVCWLTGLLWVLFDYFVTAEDEFGFVGPHPLQKTWLVTHAIASFYAIWLFGVLWPNHVKKGWTQKARRPTGGTLFGLTLWLTLTGIALYYIGNDQIRSWTSISHWAIGIGTLVVFLVHLLTRALPFDEAARKKPVVDPG